MHAEPIDSYRQATLVNDTTSRGASTRGVIAVPLAYALLTVTGGTVGLLRALERAIAMFNYGSCDAGDVAVADVPTEDGSVHQWYALSVKPRHDKSVSRTLENKGYQTFVPLYRQRRKYSTRYKEADLPLFPGYVFCRFNPVTRLPILTTPGVIQILGSGRMPIPVDETEIASLRTALKLQLPARPLPFLHAGQKVRITEGALAGVEGIVMSLKQCLRLVLSITLLQRSVLLEIDRDCVSIDSVNKPVTSNVYVATN